MSTVYFGLIYEKPIDPKRLVVGELVSFDHQYVGTIQDVNMANGKIKIFVDGNSNKVIFLDVRLLNQIWVRTTENIQNVAADETGYRKALLKRDQWSYALENYVMNGTDVVEFTPQFGAGFGANSGVCFQITTKASNTVPVLKREQLIDLVNLARERNEYYEYHYSNAEDVVDEYLNHIKS